MEYGWWVGRKMVMLAVSSPMASLSFIESVHIAHLFLNLPEVALSFTISLNILGLPAPSRCRSTWLWRAACGITITKSNTSQGTANILLILFWTTLIQWRHTQSLLWQHLVHLQPNVAWAFTMKMAGLKSCQVYILEDLTMDVDTSSTLTTRWYQ